MVAFAIGVSNFQNACFLSIKIGLRNQITITTITSFSPFAAVRPPYFMRKLSSQCVLHAEQILKFKSGLYMENAFEKSFDDYYWSVGGGIASV